MYVARAWAASVNARSRATYVPGGNRYQIRESQIYPLPPITTQ